MTETQHNPMDREFNPNYPFQWFYTLDLKRMDRERLRDILLDVEYAKLRVPVEYRPVLMEFKREVVHDVKVRKTGKTEKRTFLEVGFEYNS